MCWKISKRSYIKWFITFFRLINKKIDSGKIIKIYTTIKNAITTADAGLSFEIGGVAVGGGGITVTQSGSAAGDVDSATPSSANYVAEEQTIEMITDGASATACECEVTFVIRRTG